MAAAFQPGGSVRELTIAIAVVLHRVPTIGCAHGNHEDQFAPASRFNQRGRSDLPRVADPRGFRAMPSWRDAGGSQAAGVLFERGQRPAAGLDGGSGRSRRSRMRGQGIAATFDDHNRSFRWSAGRCGLHRRVGASLRSRLNPARPWYRVAARRRRPIASAQRASRSRCCQRRSAISRLARWRP